MKAVLLDDEPLVLTYLKKLCMQIPHLEIAAAFENAPEALEYLGANPVDLLISDIEMPGLSGLETVRRLRETHPELGVIFVTGYEEYALQAFQMDAVAYLMKPCLLEELARAVKRATLLAPPVKKIFIRTFGYFSVSIADEPIRFANRKAKELLAVLVDRNGGIVTMAQAVDVLWEERPYDEMVKRLYRKAVGYLNLLFAGTGFFIANRGSCHIVPAAADCDYFRFLNAPTDTLDLYSGEYLTDYSWGEATNGKLNQQAQRYGKFTGGSGE